MAFNLKSVLKALLFSTSQPLSIKDIQGAFARFHEQATLPDVVESEPDAPVSLSTPGPGDAADPGGVTPDAAEVVAGEGQLSRLTPPAEEVAAAAAAAPADAELYREVPSLITATQIRETMAQLADEIRAASDVYLLIEGPSGYRLVTHPRFARWIRIMRDEPPPVKLSQSALETLAIVAYRQPVTRTEIEAIRGVSAEAGLNKLIERELVYITGRADLPGRPLQYGTTDRFLDFVGVKSLVELPASDVLSPRQIDEWMKNAMTSKPPTDAEMGLPLEEGEGPTPNLESVTVDHPVHTETAPNRTEATPVADMPAEAAADEKPTPPV